MAETFEAARFGGPSAGCSRKRRSRSSPGSFAAAGTTILDVGTGTGRAAIALARRGATVTGVDASAEMLAVARRRALEAGAAVTFVQGDAHGSNVADRSFDAVVCLRVLMHTPTGGSRSPSSVAPPVTASSWTTGTVERGSAPVGCAAHRSFARSAGRGLPRVRPQRDPRCVDGERPDRGHKQFVLPIALHKRLGSATATGRVEDLLARQAAGNVRRRRSLSSPREWQGGSMTEELIDPVRVLVTGATGFTGGHLARGLKGRSGRAGA